MKKKLFDIKYFGFGDLLITAISICKAIPMYIFLPAFLVFLLNAVVTGFVFGNIFSFEMGSFSLSSFFTIALLWQLLYFVIVIFASLIMIYAIGDHLKGNEVEVYGIVSKSLNRLPMAYITGLIVSILFFAGYLMLLIPGIVLIIYTGWAVNIIAIEKKSPWGAIKESARLVTYHGWRYIFGMFLGIVLIGMLIMLIKTLLIDAFILGGVSNPVFLSGGKFWLSTISNLVFLSLMWGFVSAAAYGFFYWLYDKYKKDNADDIERLTRPGCFFYGCFWLLILFLIFAVSMLVFGYKMIVGLTENVLDDQPNVVKEMMVVPTQAQLNANDSKAALWSEGPENVPKGEHSFTVDELSAELYRALSGTTDSASTITIDNGVMDLDITIGVHELLGILTGKYLNAGIEFKLNMEDNIGIVDVIDINLGQTEFVENFVGENQFFWEDFVNSVRESEASQGSDSRGSDFVNSIKSIKMDGNEIKVNIE